MLPGALLVCLLTLLALVLQVGAVEEALVARADSRLAFDGQGWATVSVDGRDVTVIGTAPSTNAQVLAVQSANRVWGARVVIDGTGLIPVASPFVWEATRLGGTVTLRGSVPGSPARTAIAATAATALPGMQIVDKAAYARGVPQNFVAGAQFALGLLSRFDDASVELSDLTLSLRGVAPDLATFEAAATLAGEGLPQPFAVGTVAVAPPRADPYQWSATLDGGAVALSGGVPDGPARQALAEAIAAALPDAAISDSAVPASGEPAAFVAAGQFAAGILGRLQSGEVRLTGGIMTVSGTARSVDDYEAIQAALAGSLPPGFSLGPVAVGAAVVSPYFWQAVRAPGGVTLSGYVPSQEARREVLAAVAAALPGIAATDTIRVAAGAPTMDWIGAIKFGLGQLAMLASGNVGITERTYQIGGIAISVENYEAIHEALARTLPASLELGTVAVSPPLVSPYRFSAAETADGIVLAGYMPDSAGHAALLDSAAHEFRGMPVVDGIVLAGGAPEGFAAMVAAGLQAISRLDGGKMELVDTAVAISGAAFHAGAAGPIKADLASATPPDFVVTAQLDAMPPGPPASPAECQDLLRHELESGRIEFPTEQSAILAGSYGLLDRLVAILQRCPEARVEIGGHTDSDGSESFNLSLSTARANAVLDYLVAAGVLRERLDAVGYGEARPIASNGTEEGKAQNRRIEFSVLED